MSHVVHLRIPVLIFVFQAFAPHSWCQSSTPPLSKLAQAQLEQSANQVAQHILQSSVLFNRPGIAVLDFANLRDRTRSRLGVELADQFSDALESYASKFSVIPRGRVGEFLASHWLDGEEVRNEDVARWVADQLHGIVAIQGTIELLPNDQAKLLLRVVGRGRVKTIEERLALSKDMQNLFAQPAPSFAPAPEKIDDEQGIYKFGDPGVVMPKSACIYCPNPDYTDLARKVKYEGNVQLSVILGVDDRLSSIKVLKYAPFGLTERAVEIVRSWRMKPCEKDGKPVPVRVPIEMTWRLL